MSATTQIVIAGNPGQHELTSPAQWAQQEDNVDSRPNEASEPQSSRLDMKTTLKLASASFSFFVAGINDGSLGAIIPYLLRDYHVTTAIVSSTYAATFAGWLFAAATNTHLCQYLGLGSILALGAAVQILAHTLRVWMPPFGLFVFTFFPAALGQAYNDSHANSWAAGIKGAHRWLACIHASYMAGCLVGPFVATAIASAGNASKWHLFYAFPLGVGCVNLAFILWAFRDSMWAEPPSTAAQPERQQQQEETAPSKNKGALHLIKASLGSKSVWLLGMFYLCYIGSQATMNGWVVEYLVDVRGGDISRMGFVPAGLNGGCLLGRLLLAEPTYRLGERRMVSIYCCLALGLQLLFWFVPNIIAASVAVSFIGFFTGPLFATGISLGSKLFSPEIRQTALGFVFVFAQMGGSIFPIVTGVIASSAGVKVLQPIVTGILAATIISWLLVPRPKSLSNAALHQE